MLSIPAAGLWSWLFVALVVISALGCRCVEARAGQGAGNPGEERHRTGCCRACHCPQRQRLSLLARRRRHGDRQRPCPHRMVHHEECRLEHCRPRQRARFADRVGRPGLHRHSRRFQPNDVAAELRAARWRAALDLPVAPERIHARPRQEHACLGDACLRRPAHLLDGDGAGRNLGVGSDARRKNRLANRGRALRLQARLWIVSRAVREPRDRPGGQPRSGLAGVARQDERRNFLADAARQRASFATPSVAEIGGQRQILLSGHEKLVSYNPATGEKCWRFPAPPKGAATPSPGTMN